MGNWRTVTIVGSCPPGEVEELRDFLKAAGDFMVPDSKKPYDAAALADAFPLNMSNGLAGLGHWLGDGELIDASGNLGERDYGVESVAKALRAMVAFAPGLRLKVHCGDEWEAANCVATVVLEGGEVEVRPPEVETVRGASPDEMKGRLYDSLMGGGA